MHDQRVENQRARQGNAFVLLAGRPPPPQHSRGAASNFVMSPAAPPGRRCTRLRHPASQSIFNRPQDKSLGFLCFLFTVNVIVTLTEKDLFYITQSTFVLLSTNVCFEGNSF